MTFTGLVITGTSGSGKSTIARELCGQDQRFKIVRAVTTRSARHDDTTEAYEHVSVDEFQRLKHNGSLVVSAEYRGQKYGIKRSEIEKVVQRKEIPVLTITPDAASTLAGTEEAERYLIVFMDAPDSELAARLERRHGTISDPEGILRQREKDRQGKRAAIYHIENRNVHDSTALVSALWELRCHSGILPKRIIKLMIDCGMLLGGATSENIQGASYDLLLGDEYFYGGRIHHLSDSDPILMIEPYDYAIVTSHELSLLPCDVCARFDLTISFFCQGIILSNGPQVDPGFQGPLFCLLFNTSSSPVMLKRRQHYATIEFHKLLEPTEPYSGQYQSKKLLQYLPSNAARGAIHELKKELEQLRSESRRVQDITLGVLSFVLALIAVWVTFK
jgi:guanylate kinase/deoxycytidine triphosphate deaminase